MPPDTPGPADREGSASLAEKLVEFRAELTLREQNALDALMHTFYSVASLAETPGSGDDEGLRLLRTATGAGDRSLLDEVRARLSREGEELPHPMTTPVTPATPTTTLTTTIASHPIITCGGDDPPRPPRPPRPPVSQALHCPLGEN